METTISRSTIKSYKTNRISNAGVRLELMRLRSLMIGLAGKDEEGTYRPEFVERLLKAAEDKSTNVFTTSTEFLKQIRSV